MADYYKLMHNSVRGVDTEAVYRCTSREPPEVCVRECRVAVHNWTLHLLHGRDVIGHTLQKKYGWVSAVDAVAGWGKALAYWEERCR